MAKTQFKPKFELKNEKLETIKMDDGEQVIGQIVFLQGENENGQKIAELVSIQIKPGQREGGLGSCLLEQLTMRHDATYVVVTSTNKDFKKFLKVNKFKPEIEIWKYQKRAKSKNND